MIELKSAAGQGSGCWPPVAELTEPPGGLKAGEIYESNRTMLASLAARANAEPTPYPIVPDSLE